MGEGKTRVILPMLILYWRSEAKYSNFIQRHHFLSQLIEEAFQYLHYHICASVFNVKLLKMPFNRDVLLSQDRANAMYNLLSYCLRVKGVLLVTPEQRLSLELKWYELTALLDPENKSSIIDKVEKIYNFDYIDMFDESDEQFRHKCQLIYSVGSCGDLPNGPNRWRSIQSVLRSLLVPNIQTILTSSNAAVEVKPKFEISEAFPSIRFLSGKALESFWSSQIKKIAVIVIDLPLSNMQWIKNHSLFDRIINIITDPENHQLSDFDGAMKILCLNSNRMLDLIALRGILACGILKHCLQRRHRVDYGIARPHLKNKLLAVPFKASDTPAERAEFSHPDIALMYTTLSYYYDGLQEHELKQAVEMLLIMSPNAQAVEYKIWFELSKSRMLNNDLFEFDKCIKIDLSNSTQYNKLIKYYSFNFERQ
jgi:hypothetical protein